MDPLFAYGAPLRHQWMISFRFLHFSAFYKDEKYWFRQPLCEKYVPADDIPGVINRLVCQTNPAFHPDVEGAEVYAKSIEAVIPVSVVPLEDEGWAEAHVEVRPHRAYHIAPVA
jgi:hypothetical protein